MTMTNFKRFTLAGEALSAALKALTESRGDLHADTRGEVYELAQAMVSVSPIGVTFGEPKRGDDSLSISYAIDALASVVARIVEQLHDDEMHLEGVKCETQLDRACESLDTIADKLKRVAQQAREVEKCHFGTTATLNVIES